MSFQMLHGLMIADYLSIDEPQYIAPLGKVNLFVGPNNSGKSNVLRFINRNLKSLVKSARTGGDEAIGSEPHDGRGGPSHGAISVALSSESIRELLDHSPVEYPLDFARICENFAAKRSVWVGRDWPSPKLVDEAMTWASSNAWYNVWSRVFPRNNGNVKAHWIPQTLGRVRELVPETVAVYEIPIGRRADSEDVVPDKNATSTVLGGKGVIRLLAAMQNPHHSNFDESRKRFADVEEFVREVTDDSSAEISVPHHQNEIIVKLRDQRFLPLKSLGSGIEQVVLHAVAVTSVSDAVVTFEEPELHLHPILQRQLLSYLSTKTSNQYFIATHSAHLIDALHANTFHVRLVEGQTVIEVAQTDAARTQICQDLGYRASDIVQANCIIWVEGPSDRIYIRHWLKAFDSHLTAHVHYSIMFYGGKLLSHLTAEETDGVDKGLEGLIQLRKLNRQVAVVMDSDRKANGGVLRPAKVRVESEINEAGGFVWITGGREIENYVARDTLVTAVNIVAPGVGDRVKQSRFATALPSVKPGVKGSVDKVRVALEVSKADCNLDVLDLRAKIEELSKFIRTANGLKPVK